MKELFKGFWAFVWSVLVALDWKTVLYKVMVQTVVPKLEEKSKETTSKVDDVMVAGVKRAVDAWLKPDETPAPKVAA